MRATLSYGGDHGNIRGSDLRRLNILIFGGTLINLSQTQRLDEIEPALIKWLSGYLPRYQLSYVRARVLILPMVGPVRSLRLATEGAYLGFMLHFNLAVVVKLLIL